MKHFKTYVDFINEAQSWNSVAKVMDKALKKAKVSTSYAKDYVKSLERMAKLTSKKFFDEYGDFTEADFIEDVEYNMANEAKAISEELKGHAKKMKEDGISDEEIKKMHPEVTDEDLNEAKFSFSKDEVKDIALSYNFDVTNFNFTDSGSSACFEDYNIGEKIDHIDGITVEEAEHMLATKLYQNTAKVHFNHYYEKDGKFGKRIVYGGHVISLARSLSYNGLANAFKIIGINGGVHASPCFAGKTVFAWSEIIDIMEISDSIGAIRIKTNGIGDAPASEFQHQNDDDKFNQNVLLSLDYWALIPKKK